MFPVTLVLWKILPKMQFMQFPWRWLLCLSLIFTTFVALGLRRWYWRAAVCMLSIAVIVVAWHRVQAPWWDNASDLREMQDNMATGAGYEGTDEYTPAGAQPSAIDKEARSVTVVGPARAAIHVQRWDCGIEGIHRGRVGCRSCSAAIVSLSGVEGIGEWTGSRDIRSRGHRPDAGSSCRRNESSGDYICSNLGSDSRRVDLCCRRALASGMEIRIEAGC